MTAVHRSPAQPHVAFVAFPFGTHAAPLFALARTVAAAAPEAALSFLSTARSLASLPRAEGLGNIRLVPIADGTPEVSAAAPPASEQAKIGMFLAAMPGSLRAGMDDAVAGAGGAAVSCVVSDAFLWMAGEVAEAAGAPWVPLFTGGPASLSAHFHTDLLRDTIGVGERAIARSEEQLQFIPGLSAHRVCDLPEGVVFGPLDSPFSCLLHRMGQSVAKAVAVLVNTFEGLEPTIDAEFSASFSEYVHIGPLHLLVPSAGPAPDTDHCLPWLDRHAPATVAYVSFGSVMTPQPAELAALAEGLEASGAAFLWSLKYHARELLPPGFLDRTKERGLVVSWAPQLDVLRHAAVGAFVTHCGWNSVLEAMTAGVPMVCHPFIGDQRMNARSVSLVWKIGVEFEGGAITKEGVTRALDTVLKGEEGKRMKAMVCELKAMATRAVQPQGSSSVNLKRLMQFV
ncbi:UDP-glucoronosyl and UDP-glucosyl transferase [Musa troglodytarum]|uniref:Glycosyltransferase n=1 Tax=Musa troglodytarum TaxID=320322 RepID=A0A9E7IFK5_9LILI|nr:UDP-glucoronosyl and UDP-glucosyl transferase [Musa troglodytarum]